MTKEELEVQALRLLKLFAEQKIECEKTLDKLKAVQVELLKLYQLSKQRKACCG